MKKVIISILIVLVVSAAGIAVFIANQEPVIPKTAQRIIKDDNKQGRYIVDIKYPELITLADELARSDINARIKNIIDMQVSEFKKQVAEIADFIAPNDMSSGLWIDYTVPYLSNDFISIDFKASNYSAGAAHPNNYSIVLNYDVRWGAEITLADLFQQGSNYLKIVSDYAISDLEKQFGSDGMSDSDWIKTGAAPTAENYRNFIIRGATNSLVILFDPYQVAAYAVGGREVVIPTELIQDILRPGGPITP